MKIFITGTDTNIGKTVICSWLCLHTGYSYFKPIQTGSLEGTDTEEISGLVKVKTYKEAYSFKAPLSPHEAARLEKQEIDIKKISLPQEGNLIIEGAGGVLVPLNKHDTMRDLIKYFSCPVIIVASQRLGTINHTLLTIEALKMRNIEILGVILNGNLNDVHKEAIELYGGTRVLAQFPLIQTVSKENLMQIPLSQDLHEILGNNI